MKIFGYIYKITNLINEKIYIGCTVYSVKKRWTNHLADANRGNPTHIHRTIRKYGSDNFIVHQLDTAYSLKELYKMETGYIIEFDSFRNGMNMTEGGDGSHGFKASEETKKLMSKRMKGNQFALGMKHTNETKKKISDFMKGNKYKKMGFKHTLEFCEAMSIRTKGENNGFYGKQHTEKTKKLISEKAEGRKVSLETRKKISVANKGKIHSEETRRKMSEAQKGKKGNNWGKKTPDHVKIKISKSLKGENCYWYGRPKSKILKQKISLGLKRYYKEKIS